MSSWSSPIMLAPLLSKTPMTWKGTFRIRMFLPRGDSSANSSRLTVAPITQTRLPWVTSRSVKNLALVQVSPVATPRDRQESCR